MGTRLGKYLKPLVVPLLPSWLLTHLVWARPDLLEYVPSGRSLRWPHYMGDIVVWVDPGNVIERTMVFGYEPGVIRAVERFATPGSYCLDVGANVGAVALALARQVGPAGRVLAIEPGPSYLARLRQNLLANPHLADRVVIVPVGLGESDGSQLWRPDPLHPFNARLSQVHVTAVPGELPINVTTLDEAVSRQGWKQVDFIKIDVEGMELEVLLGARGTLASLRPVVLFETLEVFRTGHLVINGIADVFAEIEEYLRGLNYRLYDLQSDGSLHPVTAAALPDNTLAIPMERRL